MCRLKPVSNTALRLLLIGYALDPFASESILTEHSAGLAAQPGLLSAQVGRAIKESKQLTNVSKRRSCRGAGAQAGETPGWKQQLLPANQPLQLCAADCLLLPGLFYYWSWTTHFPSHTDIPVSQLYSVSQCLDYCQEYH